MDPPPPKPRNDVPVRIHVVGISIHLEVRGTCYRSTVVPLKVNGFAEKSRVLVSWPKSLALMFGVATILFCT